MADTYAAAVRRLAKTLRERRLALNFSQEHVAAEVGIATRHYQDLEYGVAANPKLETLCRLADVLQATVGDLLDSPKTAKPDRERATKAALKPKR